MKHTLLIILIALCTSIYAKERSSNINGNWFDDKGNWVLTITESRLIYENKIYDYTKEELNRKQVLLHIVEDLDLAKVSITISDGDNIDISLNSEEKVYHLSKVKAVENPLLYNDVSNEPDLVTINGFIKNAQKYQAYNHVKIERADWMTVSSSSLFAEIDSSGFFSITFLQAYPSQFTLSYNYGYDYLFVAPGDTLTVYVDADHFPKNRLVMGNHADIAYDFAKFGKHSGKRVRRNSILNPQKEESLDMKSYQLWRDSLRIDDHRYADDYISDNECSIFFKKRLRHHYDYKYMRDIASRYTTELYRYKPEVIDTGYLTLLEAIDFSDPSSADGVLFEVVNRYGNIFNYQASQRSSAKGVSRSLTVSSNNSSGLSLSDAEEVLDAEPTHIPKSIRLTVSADEYIKEVNTIDNVLIRDALVASSYSRFEDYYDPDTLAFTLYKALETDIVKDRLHAVYYKDKYLQNELKFNSLTDDAGQILLGQLIKKHENKVLYIDFWGVHCGPCLGDFERVKPLKEYYKNEDVAFIYLCERGNEKRWQEIIDKYEVSGDHYLLNNKELVGLSKMFNLSYVPRYIIIDKAGKVVDTNAPRPMGMLDNILKDIINKCLE